MGPIPQKNIRIQTGKVGVEAAHGFGDGLFSAPLIKAISKKHSASVAVTVRPHCKDAFFNLPFVSEIIEIPEMHHGTKLLRQRGYQHIYQITQNIKFFEFKNQDPNHSLIDTPLCTGRQIGIPNFDQRPLFAASPEELAAPAGIPNDKPIIAIESIYQSAQSWAQAEHIAKIFHKFKNTHRILWLSNQGAPNHASVDSMLRFTRRQCIMCLSRCQYFFSVGSGFFCASLALPPSHQPKNIICLWTDNLYKYEGRITELNWHPQITWVHGPIELDNALNSIK